MKTFIIVDFVSTQDTGVERNNCALPVVWNIVLFLNMKSFVDWFENLTTRIFWEWFDFLCKIWVISAEVSSLPRPFNIGHRSSINYYFFFFRRCISILFSITKWQKIVKTKTIKQQRINAIPIPNHTLHANLFFVCTRDSSCIFSASSSPFCSASSKAQTNRSENADL